MLALLACSLIQTPPAVLTAVTPDSYRRAVLARQNGNPSEAKRVLEQWLQAHPQDADARLQYGYALLDLDRKAEAEAAFHQVLELSPNYADAHLGLARLAHGRGDVAGARKWLSLLPIGYPDASLIRAQLAQAVEPRWSLDVGGAVTAVGRQQPNWQEAFTQFGFRPDARTGVSGRVEASRRFGLQDNYGELQVTRRFSSNLTGYLVAGGTPRADYRPSWQFGGGVSARVHGSRNATVLSLDLRIASFRTGQITTLQPGIEQYLFGDKAWASSRLILLADHGRVHAGALGRIDFKAGSRLRLFAGAAYAPDTSTGFVSRVSTLFGGVEASMSSRQVVRVLLSQSDEQVGASRTELALSAGQRF